MKVPGIDNATDLNGMQLRIQAKIREATQQVGVRVESVQATATEVKLIRVIRESRERAEVIEEAPNSLADGWLRGLG